MGELCFNRGGRTSLEIWKADQEPSCCLPRGREESRGPGPRGRAGRVPKGDWPSVHAGGPATSLPVLCNAGVNYTYDLMQKLHERYHGLMRQTAPDKMRTPTINEVRRFDRELMKQALQFKSEGQGEIGHCLEYYLDNPNSGLWKLLDVVPEKERRMMTRMLPL